MFIINGERWDVELVPPNHPSLLRSNGSFSIGSCDDNRKLICINAFLSKELFKKVLCHEITHAAMFSYNIDLDDRLEEIIADLLATHGEEIVYITNVIFDKMERAE